MKTLKYIMSIVLGVLVLACNPIEDRDMLTNSYDPDNIELVAIQTANGTGNGITLKMNTPGVYGYWDYKLNIAKTDEVDFVFPIPGVTTFTYYVAAPYIPGGDLNQAEFITKTIDVDVQVLDQPLPEAYYALVGDDLGGKTWVFDGGPDPDGRQWWFMADPGNPWGMWWNAGGDCCVPADAAGKMVFDLDGAANYTYYADAAGAAGGTGSFVFNTDYTKLTIVGGLNILGAGSAITDNPPVNRGNNAGEYTIAELTADRMVLFTPNNDGNTGWTFVFIPEE